MIDETLFGGFPSRRVKADIYNGVSETRAVSPPPRGFDINVTRRSFEFMNYSRFHKAQLGTDRTSSNTFGWKKIQMRNCFCFIAKHERMTVSSCSAYWKMIK